MPFVTGFVFCLYRNSLHSVTIQAILRIQWGELPVIANQHVSNKNARVKEQASCVECIAHAALKRINARIK